MTGWGVHFQELNTASAWSLEDELHINMLEMKVGQLSLDAFLFWILGESGHPHE